MNRFILALVLFFYASFAWSSQGQDQLEKNLGKIEGFSAQFEQQLRNANAQVLEHSSGKMSFKRPGKFYWAYTQPYKQEIISDGKTLWVYDKDLEQVSIRPAKQSLKNTPIMLLNDPDSISTAFEIELLPNTDSGEKIRLLPKQDDAGFKYVVLSFEDSVLTGMEIYDNFDQHNLLTFRDIDSDKLMSDASFHFEPPDGVDIIRAAE